MLPGVDEGSRAEYMFNCEASYLCHQTMHA